MHCAVRSTYTDNQKFFEGGKFYSLNKSFEKDNFRASLEVMDFHYNDQFVFDTLTFFSSVGLKNSFGFIFFYLFFFRILKLLLSTRGTLIIGKTILVSFILISLYDARE